MIIGRDCTWSLRHVEKSADEQEAMLLLRLIARITCDPFRERNVSYKLDAVESTDNKSSHPTYSLPLLVSVEVHTLWNPQMHPPTVKSKPKSKVLKFQE